MVVDAPPSSLFDRSLRSLRRVWREVSGRRFARSRISAEDVAITTRQLAVLVGAGIPLVEALGALVDQVDHERMNELQVNLTGSTPGARAQGFRTVLVSESDHPFWEHWWPHGHIIGWEHTFVHELHHVLRCIATDEAVGPHGATFEDGYRTAEICDAILRSAESGRREAVTYRQAGPG